jgi:hypothetical protein
VSATALVVESDAETAAKVIEDDPAAPGPATLMDDAPPAVDDDAEPTELDDGDDGDA